MILDINDRIKVIRVDSGLSQTAFAERLGTTRGVITNLEFKKTTPNNSFLGLICREFGVSQTWLQTGEGEMFLPRSKNEELALMVADLMAESDDSFRKRFVSAFLAFPPNKLAVLEEFIDLLADAKNTEDI